MDTMEVNKAVAAVLVAGIAFFITGTIGIGLVHERPLKEPAIKIEGVPAAPAANTPAPEAELPPIATYMATADESAGEAYAKKVCAACHTFAQGQPAGVGPNLYGVVGGPHAHMQGFNYSDALKAKKGPWTYDELNHWLYKPSAYAPGTRMSFAGIPSEKERANVIDYLRSLSPHPEPLPSATSAAVPASATAPAPAAGEAKQTGSSQGTQPSASGGPPAEQSGTAARAQQTQPAPPEGAAPAGTPTPAAKSP